MTDFKTWDHDPQARAVYRAIEGAVNKAIEELCPKFKVVQFGINTSNLFERGEVEFRIHLKENVRSMPGEAFFTGQYLPQNSRTE